jgi:hypothetical protein
MKKLLPVSLIVLSIFLVSCGKKNLDNVIITPNTPIENRDQSAKVCEPVLKYLKCSLEKAPEASKPNYEKAIKDTQRKIDNDSPEQVAQYCDTTVKILIDKADVVSKNGCFVEAPTYTIPAPEVKTPEATPAPTPPVIPKKETAKQ